MARGNNMVGLFALISKITVSADMVINVSIVMFLIQGLLADRILIKDLLVPERREVIILIIILNQVLLMVLFLGEVQSLLDSVKTMVESHKQSNPVVFTVPQYQNVPVANQGHQPWLPQPGLVQQ